MFGEKLKKLRMDKKMTQQELAKILKISSSTIGMYEQNRRSPDIETLKSISDYFQCSTDYLLEKNNIENSSSKTNEIDNIFGDRLRYLREEKGITQKELGSFINVSDRVVGYYESNDRFPKDENTIKKIADYFNVSIDYLLGRSDIRNPYNNSTSTPNPKSLGKIISEYRQKNNLSLQDFATKADLKQEYVDNLEKEKVLKSPSLGDVCKIAQSMNIPEMDLLEQIGYVKPNPESDKILKRCNELLEEYIKSHKNDDENNLRSKGLYTTLLIKKLFEDGLINDDGEIDDSYMELIKASLKTDSKLLNKISDQ